jgi:hypothetical protein
VRRMPARKYARREWFCPGRRRGAREGGGRHTPLTQTRRRSTQSWRVGGKASKKRTGGVAARTYQSSSSSCPCTALPRGGECHPVVVRAREEGWSEDCFLGTLGGGGRRTRRRLNWLSPFKRGGFRTKIHWPGTRACGRGEPPNKPNARVDGACRVPRAVIDPRGVFETRARSRGCVGNREGTRGRVQKKLASAGVQPPFADLRVGPPIFLLAYLGCGQLKWVL